MIQTILIAIGLSMDAAAVSMSDGLADSKMKLPKVLLIALFFGVFQGVMPLLGYLLGSNLANVINVIAPYLALVLLGFIGGKMIYEGIKHKDEEAPSLKIGGLFVQAIATSIDALAVGLVFVGNPLTSVLIDFAVIGLVTFVISLASVFIGKKFGTLLSNKACIVGGIILIAIGLKIFIEYIISLF